MTRNTASAKGLELPKEILDLFDLAPLLSSECEESYFGMMRLFAEFIRPSDFIAWTFVQDLADNRTEILRYRRLKVAMLERAGQRSVSKARSEVDLRYWDKKNKAEAEAKKDKEKFAAENNSAEATAAKNAEIDATASIKIAEAEQAWQHDMTGINAQGLTDDHLLSITTGSTLDQIERFGPFFANRGTALSYDSRTD